MVATHPPRAEFDPAPDTADAIIDALADPAATLRDVARAFATTIEPLARWLQRPEILARLDLIEAAITRRARFLAAHALPSVVKSLTRTIDHHHAEEAKAEATNAEETKASEANAPNFPTSTPTPAALTRARDAARKAAGLLLRIAKWTTPQPRPKQSSHQPTLHDAPDSLVQRQPPETPTKALRKSHPQPTPAPAGTTPQTLVEPTPCPATPAPSLPDSSPPSSRLPRSPSSTS